MIGNFFLYAITVSWRADFYLALALGDYLCQLFFRWGSFLVGVFAKNKKALNTGLAVAQAAISCVLISSFYKVFTGKNSTA